MSCGCSVFDETLVENRMIKL